MTRNCRVHCIIILYFTVYTGLAPTMLYKSQLLKTLLCCYMYINVTLLRYNCVSKVLFHEFIWFFMLMFWVTVLLVIAIYTHPNFQRPHFQFDAVWLIDHVKLWNFTTTYINKASLKFFLKFWYWESFGDIMTSHVILTLRPYSSHRCSKIYKIWL